MPDYKASLITGTAWQRAWRVTCENPLDGQRSMTFEEERVLLTGMGPTTMPAGRLGMALTPASATTEFMLLDPDTGEQLGKATYADAYQMLHSLYIHAAQQRDAHLASLVPQEPQTSLPDWP